MEKIKLKKSPTADTRTCDVATVTKQQLKDSTTMHIQDVGKALKWMRLELYRRALRHDYTKLTKLDDFYKDFSNNFKTDDWWKYHQKTERHHISSEYGVRDDVDLFDVMQYVADSVVAALARRGQYKAIQLDSDMLSKAVNNTINKLIDMIEVESD